MSVPSSAPPTKCLSLLPLPHYVYDANGNVTEIFDSTSATAAHYEYSTFGEPLRVTGAIAEANPFRFSTKYQDAESNLLYYGYRYYNSDSGRWLSRDPAEESDGPNIYAFVHNKPVDAVDSDGRQFFDPPNVGPLIKPAKWTGIEVKSEVNWVLAQVDEAWKDWNTLQRCRACTYLLADTENGWDILLLDPRHFPGDGAEGKFVGRQPAPDSAEARDIVNIVTFRGLPYHRGAVNYTFFGKASRLCFDYYNSAKSDAALLYTLSAARTFVKIQAWVRGSQKEETLGFMEFGYTGNIFAMEKAALPQYARHSNEEMRNLNRKLEWVWMPNHP